jgi:hypothetical protein
MMLSVIDSHILCNPEVSVPNYSPDYKSSWLRRGDVYEELVYLTGRLYAP